MESEEHFYLLILDKFIDFMHPLLFSFTFWTYGTGIILIGIAWWYLFWRPFDLYRDFTEFGFSEANRKPPGKGNNVARRNLINELRNRRKMGELPPVYPNGWYIVLETQELTKSKSCEINCLGLTLVAWRGESGKSYVADAYCPHLGAHLGVNGEVNGECIRCPFHGWAFEGNNGKCVDIPYSDSVPDFARIKIWETVEMNGFIYLWFHAEGDQPTWYPEAIPEIASGKWKYRGRSEFKAACHIQEVPENGADLSHLNVVHKSAMMTGGSPTEAKLKWGFLKHVWSGSWTPNPDPKLSHRALMTLTHSMSLFNSIPFMEISVQANQVGPGIVYLKFQAFGGEGVLFFMVTPLEPLCMKITHSFYSSRSMLHPFGLLILLGEAIQLERDIAIWNRKTYISKPLLTKEDRAIKLFRRWFSQFYSENSPRLAISKELQNPTQTTPDVCNNSQVRNRLQKDLSF